MDVERTEMGPSACCDRIETNWEIRMEREVGSKDRELNQTESGLQLLNGNRFSYCGRGLLFFFP